MTVLIARIAKCNYDRESDGERPLRTKALLRRAFRSRILRLLPLRGRQGEDTRHLLTYLLTFSLRSKKYNI